MHTDPIAAQVAAIRSAAWWIRNTRPNAAGRHRIQQALQVMRQAVRTGLEIEGSEEAILYAVAQGLHDRSDPRFQS